MPSFTRSSLVLPPTSIQECTPLPSFNASVHHTVASTWWITVTNICCNFCIPQSKSKYYSTVYHMHGSSYQASSEITGYPIHAKSVHKLKLLIKHSLHTLPALLQVRCNAYRPRNLFFMAHRKKFSRNNRAVWPHSPGLVSSPLILCSLSQFDSNVIYRTCSPSADQSRLGGAWKLRWYWCRWKWHEAI